MKLQFENVNVNKLHKEIDDANIPMLKKPESLNGITWIYVEENQVDAVNAIVAIHDPTPLPMPKTELEKIQDDMDIMYAQFLDSMGVAVNV